MTSRPDAGLSFHGLDALSLSLLKTAGTTAAKKYKNIINICRSFSAFTNINSCKVKSALSNIVSLVDSTHTNHVLLSGEYKDWKNRVSYGY